MQTIILADDNHIKLSYNKTKIMHVGTVDEGLTLLQDNPDAIVSIGTRYIHDYTLREYEKQGLDPIIHLHLKAERHHYLINGGGPAESYSELCIYEEQIRDICKKNGWTLLVDDELQEYIDQMEEI